MTRDVEGPADGGARGPIRIAGEPTPAMDRESLDRSKQRVASVLHEVIEVDPLAAHRNTTARSNSVEELNEALVGRPSAERDPAIVVRRDNTEPLPAPIGALPGLTGTVRRFLAEAAVEGG